MDKRIQGNRVCKNCKLEMSPCCKSQLQTWLSLFQPQTRFSSHFFPMQIVNSAIVKIFFLKKKEFQKDRSILLQEFPLNQRLPCRHFIIACCRFSCTLVSHQRQGMTDQNQEDDCINFIWKFIMSWRWKLQTIFVLLRNQGELLYKTLNWI